MNKPLIKKSSVNALKKELDEHWETIDWDDILSISLFIEGTLKTFTELQKKIILQYRAQVVVNDLELHEKMGVEKNLSAQDKASIFIFAREMGVSPNDILNGDYNE